MLSMRHAMRSVLPMCLLLVGDASDAEIVKGPYTFDDDAFVDQVLGVGPTVVPFPLFPPGDVVTNMTDTLTSTGAQLRAGDFLDLAFLDNVAVNGPGIDLVIFEFFDPTSIDLTIEIGGTTHPVIGAGPPTNIDGLNVNAIEVDLTDFGFAEGSAISDLRISSSSNFPVAAVSLIGALYTSLPPDEDLIVSYGVQGGQPSVETYGGVSVAPQQAINLDKGVIVSARLPDLEDLDALHIRSDGSVLFSTSTSVFLDGTQFFPSDVVSVDASGYALVFDGTLLDAAQNVDAVSELGNGDLLISTQTAATLFGFSFSDGDVVVVDVDGAIASLFMGLDEATLFTGTNQNIDALHFDAEFGNLLISLGIDGVGSVGGLAYAMSDEISTDLIDLDLSGGVSASILVDGDGLYDGATRQLDAVYLPEPSVASALAGGAALVLLLGRRRRAGGVA
jgi:hypothetical protein